MSNDNTYDILRKELSPRGVNPEQLISGVKKELKLRGYTLFSYSEGDSQYLMAKEMRKIALLELDSRRSPQNKFQLKISRDTRIGNLITGGEMREGGGSALSGLQGNRSPISFWWIIILFVLLPFIISLFATVYNLLSYLASSAFGNNTSNDALLPIIQQLIISLAILSALILSVYLIKSLYHHYTGGLRFSNDRNPSKFEFTIFSFAAEYMELTTSKSTSVKTCWNCFSTLTDDWSFCSHCGKTL